MSKFEGTPWSIDTNHDKEIEIVGAGAWVDNDDRDSGVEIANLLSAAPELFELVELANHGFKGSHTVAWQEKARASIAKARGQS
jgi:hypothetical protein